MSDSDSSVEEGQYVVEDIINHRVVNGKLQFLLKWKGYDDNENSWINQKDLHCDEILDKYLSKNKAQIDEDLAKVNKKKKNRKKLTQKQNSSSSHQEIKNQTNTNLESAQNKTNNEISTGSILSNIKKENLNSTENKPKINNQEQNQSVPESDSDVVEIKDIIINNKSINNENNNKKSNEISLDKKNSNDQSTTKSSIDSTLKSSINTDPKSLNNSKLINSEQKISNDSSSNSLNDSNPKNSLNSINNHVVSENQSHSVEDSYDKPDYKIIAILSHEIIGSKLMCNCLTDKINCVKIPVNQVKKTNLKEYLQYLESEVVNPF